MMMDPAALVDSDSDDDDTSPAASGSALPTGPSVASVPPPASVPPSIHPDVAAALQDAADDPQQTRGATVLLSRGMTPAAVNDFLSSEPSLRELAGKLGAGVDGDVLIDVTAAAGKADGSALMPLFSEGASIGLLTKLALRLNQFVQVEELQKKNAGKRAKQERTEEKQAKLRAQIAREKAAAVTAGTAQLLFEANKSAAEAAVQDIEDKKRARFERDGCTFTVTVPEHPQPHFAYLLENRAQLLADLRPHPPYVGGKLLDIGVVLKKGKAKGATMENKTELKIWVPGYVVAAQLAQREKERKDLLLNIPQGPYCAAQFMSYVSKHLADSTQVQHPYYHTLLYMAPPFTYLTAFAILGRLRRRW